MKLLVTGGCGFIGSNFIKYMLEQNNYHIVNLDKLTYAGQGQNIEHMGLDKNPYYKFIQGDILDSKLVNSIFEEYPIDVIVNFAAESHNSYAILNPLKFAETNTMGTVNLLEAVRKHKNNIRFHHISTCEVYGDLSLVSKKKFSEESPYRPNTPYNCSKAAADIFIRAYFKTFNLPVTISNCGNNYGPYQHPEKLIPRFATNLIDNIKVPVYKSSQNRREWIHVLDHCKAIDLILNKGRIGESYNVGSGIEKSIEEITEIILTELHQPESMKMYVEDRPSHDRRYLLDSSKITNELGWKPEIIFEQGIKDVIEWYKNHPEWWRPLKEKEGFIQEDQWAKS